MTQNKDSKTNYHEEENAMVTDLDDLKDSGKEMEQISEENDEDKLNQSHDSDVRSDLEE
ncbi:SAS053 family DNA gyrase inhibitor [Staphylococcus pasteuri]|uniref:SAS053 family DNA gyrase inhibitor n=1 Tax=Staphylococcus pasteuri TaxID=45972 RepID=UPI003D00153C